MNCRQATTRLRSSQLAGRMPHGPSSSTFAPGTAARTGEWVATTSWEPAVARSCSSAAAHRVGAQEIRAARPDAPDHDEVAADAWLALPDPERLAQRRTSLRVQPVRLGQRLHHGGLPRPVLAHQHGQASGKLEAVP